MIIYKHLALVVVLTLLPSSGKALELFDSKEIKDRMYDSIASKMMSMDVETLKITKETVIGASTDLIKERLEVELAYPPNIDQMTFGFNVLLGVPPYEQRERLIGSKLFSLTEDDGNSVLKYKVHDQFSDFSTVEICNSRDSSETVSWATGCSSVRSQGSGLSFGRSVQFGESIPLAGITKNGINFGNSRTTVNSFDMRSSGMTYSFEAMTERQLYAVETNVSTINTWTDDFKDACSLLSSSNDTLQVLNFFSDFGTHGLATASFGQRCTASIFLEDGYSITEYSAFKSRSSSFSASLLWWRFSRSQMSTSTETTTSEFGFRTEVSDRRCYGEIAAESACGGGMPGTGRDAPSIISWNYKPIWEMNVPQLNENAKDMLKNVFNQVLAASEQCALTHCNGNGACAPNQNWWTTKEFNTGEINFDDSYDGDKCFCVDEYVGTKCEMTREIRLGEPELGGFKNDFDGPLTYFDHRPLCGVNAFHNNRAEDRIFRFRTCTIDEPSYDDKLGGDQVTDYTRTDLEFRLECGTNRVIVGIESEHNNFREDRRWRITCRQFKDTRTGGCIGFPTAYANELDAVLDYTCPLGKVLTGIDSIHDNRREDRRFRFKCCSLFINKDTSTDVDRKLGVPDDQKQQPASK